MPNFIVRFSRPLRNALFPRGGKHRRQGPATLPHPPAAPFRPAVVFVHACHSDLNNRHSAFLLPYPRGEFERWERAVQRLSAQYRPVVG